MSLAVFSPVQSPSPVSVALHSCGKGYVCACISSPLSP